MKNLFFILLTGIFYTTGQAQTACPDTAQYRTYTVGDGKEQLPYAITTLLIRDTLLLCPGHAPIMLNYDTRFKLLSKKCNWNADQTKGESVYEAMLIPDGKKANIKISFGERRQIVIMYEYSKEPIVLE